MQRVESIHDEMNGVVTYEFPNGKRVRLDRRMVQDHGLPEMLRVAGVADLVPNERVVVMQYGRKIGTVPPAFDPLFIKSQNYLYNPRHGDFVREGDVWVASRMLGPGDLEAVPGFVWDRQQ